MPSLSPLDTDDRAPRAQPEAVAAGQAPESERSRRTGDMVARIAASDDPVAQAQLRRELVLLNMDVARGIASRYHGRGVASEDLAQAAYMGLVKAARGFDPSYDRDFLAYAVPTITGELKRYFRDSAWAVRPPRGIQELRAEVMRASAELSQRLQRSPTPREVATHLEVGIESVIDALVADSCYTAASLDVPTGDGEAGVLGDQLSWDDPDLRRAEARVMLAPAVRKLDERDRMILALRFFHGCNQEQIGKAIGVSQMQVSRLLSRIYAELRAGIDVVLEE